jgi:alkanesulfonate monooxygenase SsuD/methylene tetrahydromethanopterin reductase-like flavin-dependent oxidoreductase (luciferase family)
MGRVHPLAAAMAVATDRIGIVATAHTEYNEPFNIARRTASLDHLSHGRAGWNVATSASRDQAVNFGRDEQPPREERYARAEEFVEVVKGLWDSWEDDAYLLDKQAGDFYDPSKMHVLEHRGDFYEVRGPLNIMRPPQG